MRSPSILARTRLLAGLVLALTVAALVPREASAAPPPGIDAAKNKRFRFNLGTDLFSLIHIDPDGAPSSANVNVIGFGIGRRTALDAGTVGIGIARGVASLGFGGVILDGRAVVGAKFAFTVDGLDVSNNGGTAIEGRFVPYFNWMFGPFGRVRPFVGLHFGLGGGSFTTQQGGDPVNPPVRVVTNVIYPVVGPQGGVHIFLVEHVSLDALLNLDYFAPFARTKVDDPMAMNDPSFNKVADVVNFAFVNLGISAWF